MKFVSLKRHKLIFFSLLYIFIIVFIQVKYYSSNNSNSDQKSNFIGTELCEPPIKNAKQFFVEIDGETYRKIVPAYLNESIDLKCLTQRSNNTKVFLLWNPGNIRVIYLYDAKTMLDNPPVKNA
jgi:hypothetical protein